MYVDLARFACQVALGSTGQSLHHVSAGALCLEPWDLQTFYFVILLVALVIKGFFAALLAAQRLPSVLFLALFPLWISSQDEAMDAGIFHRRVDGHPAAWRKLVELFDFVRVAEAIAPPTAQVVDAVAPHTLEQLPPTICSAYELLVLLGFGLLGRRGAVLRHLVGYDRYGTEVALPLQYNGLVCVFERILGGWCVCGRLLPLRELLCFLRVGRSRTRGGVRVMREE